MHQCTEVQKRSQRRWQTWRRAGDAGEEDNHAIEPLQEMMQLHRTVVSKEKDCTHCADGKRKQFTGKDASNSMYQDICSRDQWMLSTEQKLCS